jgi:hypothetical protein
MSDATIPRSPTTPEIQEGMLENKAWDVAPRKVDTTYKYEINKYKKWVDEQRLVRHGKYVTRDNIDLYITEVQKDQLVNINTGQCVISALQAYPTVPGIQLLPVKSGSFSSWRVEVLETQHCSVCLYPLSMHCHVVSPGHW